MLQKRASLQEGVITDFGGSVYLGRGALWLPRGGSAPLESVAWLGLLHTQPKNT